MSKKPFIQTLSKKGLPSTGVPFWIPSNIEDIKVSVNHYFVTHYSFSGRLIEGLRNKTSLADLAWFRKHFNVIVNDEYKLTEEDVLCCAVVENASTFGIIMCDYENDRVYQIDVTKLRERK